MSCTAAQPSSQAGRIGREPDADAGGANRFCFTLHGRAYQAEFASRDPGARLTIEADLGPLPFTAEDPARREALQDLAAASWHGMPYGRILLERGRIRLALATEVPADPSPIGVVRAATAAVLETLPWTSMIWSLLPDQPRGTTKI